MMSLQSLTIKVSDPAPVNAWLETHKSAIIRVRREHRPVGWVFWVTTSDAQCAQAFAEAWGKFFYNAPAY